MKKIKEIGCLVLAAIMTLLTAVIIVDNKSVDADVNRSIIDDDALAFHAVGAAVRVQYLPADRQAQAAAALVALLLVGLEVAVPHVR